MTTISKSFIHCVWQEELCFAFKVAESAEADSSNLQSAHKVTEAAHLNWWQANCGGWVHLELSNTWIYNLQHICLSLPSSAWASWDRKTNQKALVRLGYWLWVFILKELETLKKKCLKTRFYLSNIVALLCTYSFDTDTGAVILCQCYFHRISSDTFT